MAKTSSPRHEWIDLLRGLAVVVMIWVHAANTCLEASLQSTAWYQGLSFYHGLVAPTFFWLAGLMRGLAVAGGRPKRSPWPTVRRLLIILGVAYLLHLPQALGTPGDWATKLRIAAQADVLHCLALSCLALVAVERLSKGTTAAVIALLLFFVVGTPWAAQHSTGWAVVDAYLSREQGSLFALFPWLGFAAAGWLCGRWLMRPAWLVGLGLLLMFGAPLGPYAWEHVWFFFERLGWVLVLAAITWVSCEWLLRWQRVKQALAFLQLAGRESLVMYAAHLLLLYAVPMPRQPLAALWDKALPLSAVGALWLGLLLLSLMCAWVAERCRKS